jgi:hypothetical protein
MEQHKLNLDDLKVLLAICEKAILCDAEFFIEKKTSVFGDERLVITAPEKLESPIMQQIMVPHQDAKFLKEYYKRLLEEGTKLYEEYVSKDQEGRENDRIHPVVKVFENLSGIVIE